MINLLEFLDINGYRDGSWPSEEFIHVNFYDGGLGDHICRLSAIKYIIDEYPFVKLTVWCPKFFLPFGQKAIPKVHWQVFDHTKKVAMSQQPINAGSTGGVTSLRMHLVDHAFMKIVDKQVPIERKNYVKVNHKDVNLDKFKLPAKYVVVTTGHTVKVRELIPSIVNEITAFIKSTGYDVIFLGSREATVGSGVVNIKGLFSEGVDYSVGLDLRDQTDLIEAHAIIAQSNAIVGLDNGLLHLAGCTDVPIVMGFTTVSPEYRIPYRNNQLGWNTYVVEPPASLKCRGCQSNMNFVYNFDFRNCWYVEKKKDNKIRCTQDATSQPYIEHLKKILTNDVSSLTVGDGL